MWVEETIQTDMIDSINEKKIESKNKNKETQNKTNAVQYDLKPILHVQSFTLWGIQRMHQVLSSLNQCMRSVNMWAVP